jgi:hypothetical protein
MMFDEERRRYGFCWCDQPAALLEQHGNPRVAVPDFQDALDRYAAHSAAARQRITPMGTPPPRAVRRAKALPFRRASQGNGGPPCNEPPRSRGRRSPCEDGEAIRMSDETGSITWFVVWHGEGLQALSSYSRPPLGPSSNHPLCGWYMILPPSSERRGSYVRSP